MNIKKIIVLTIFMALSNLISNPAYSRGDSIYHYLYSEEGSKYFMELYNMGPKDLALETKKQTILVEKACSVSTVDILENLS